MGSTLSREEAKLKLQSKCFEYAKKKDGYKKLSPLLANRNITNDDIARALKNTNENGETLLMLACAHLRLKTVILLLKHGATIYEQNLQNGYTPLHYACSGKSIHLEAARNLISYLLLDAHADPLIRDYLQRLPVHLLQLKHIGKKSPQLLRLYEKTISQFTGYLKVETFNSLSAKICYSLGQNQGMALLQKLGSSWRDRWCVVTKLLGSKAGIRKEILRCPECFKFNPYSQTQCKFCFYSLPAPPPPKQSVYDTLTIYESRNSIEPMVILNLRGCEIEFLERSNVIRLKFKPELQEYSDPLLCTSPELVGVFGHNRNRLFTRERNLIHLRACVNIMDITNAFQALTSGYRNVPEGISPSVTNNTTQFQPGRHASEPQMNSFSNKPPVHGSSTEMPLANISQIPYATVVEDPDESFSVNRTSEIPGQEGQRPYKTPYQCNREERRCELGPNSSSTSSGRLEELANQTPPVESKHSEISQDSNIHDQIVNGVNAIVENAWSEDKAHNPGTQF